MSKHVCPECKSDDTHQFQSLAANLTRTWVCECRQCGWFGTPEELKPATLAHSHSSDWQTTIYMHDKT